MAWYYPLIRILFYGRVYHDVPGTYIVWQIEKSAKNTLLS